MSSVSALNARPSSAMRRAAQRAEVALELADDAPLLQVVHLDHRRQELEVVPGVAGELLQRLHVLREAAAAVADARAQEVRADAARRGPSPLGDHADVGAHLLADVGDLVDERDLGRQERVRGVLDHLGAGRRRCVIDRRVARRRRGSRRHARRPRSNAPITIRSGSMKSATARPSRRNSGFDDVADVPAGRARRGPRAPSRRCPRARCSSSRARTARRSRAARR